MPANEFEINMQRKMEELNLDPSTDVWQEVERRIRKEKKRRGIFFWLILGGLLLGGGTIALLVKNKDRKNEISVNQIKKQDGSNTEQEKINTKNTSDVDNTSTTDLQIKENKQENSLPDNNTTKTEQPPPPNLELKIKEKENPPVIISAKKELVNKKKGTKEKQVISNPKTEIVSSKIPVDKPIQKTNIETQPIPPADPRPDTGSTTAKNILPEKEEKKIETAPVIQPDVSMPESKTDSTKKKEKKNEKKKEWSFWVQAGVSGNVSGFRLFDNRLYSSSLGLGSSPGGSTQSIQNVKPGPSFSTGMSLRLPVAPRLNLNTGFGYDYLSTRVMASELTDSMGIITNPSFADLIRTRFYPASGNLSAISNKFHFLSISAELSWRIINKKNFSLYWDNGMSYKLLLASRVLHYNRGLNGYYVDPRLVSKHYAFVSTGLSIPLSKKVILRPFAEYSLTRVLKNHDTANVHFTNYGLRIKISLGGKK